MHLKHIRTQTVPILFPDMHRYKGEVACSSAMKVRWKKHWYYRQYRFYDYVTIQQVNLLCHFCDLFVRRKIME